MDVGTIKDTIDQMINDEGGSKISVRILTADLKETSLAVAKQVNIITSEDDEAACCMTGQEFEDKLKSAKLIVDKFLEAPIDEDNAYENWWKNKFTEYDEDYELTEDERE